MCAACFPPVRFFLRFCFSWRRFSARRSGGPTERWGSCARCDAPKCSTKILFQFSSFALRSLELGSEHLAWSRGPRLRALLPCEPEKQTSPRVHVFSQAPARRRLRQPHREVQDSHVRGAESPKVPSLMLLLLLTAVNCCSCCCSGCSIPSILQLQPAVKDTCADWQICALRRRSLTPEQPWSTVRGQRQELPRSREPSRVAVTGTGL